MPGVCNVATGKSHSLLTMIDLLSRIVGQPLPISHQAARPGDIPHSVANVDLLRQSLGIRSSLDFEEGLRQLVNSELRNSKLGINTC